MPNPPCPSPGYKQEARAGSPHPTRKRILVCLGLAIALYAAAYVTVGASTSALLSGLVFLAGIGVGAYRLRMWWWLALVWLLNFGLLMAGFVVVRASSGARNNPDVVFGVILLLVAFVLVTFVVAVASLMGLFSGRRAYRD